MPLVRIHDGESLSPAVASGAHLTGGGCAPAPSLFAAPARSARRPRSATSTSTATGASSRRRFAPICSSRVGDAYDAGKVDGSIKALFATGLFADVRIDRSGADVIVTVVENPVINQVAFEGNSEVDTETLRNEVQLKPRSVFTRARVQADVQRILDVYRRQGRYRGDRRAEDHRARAGPREPRVRDHRGRRHQGQGHQLRRQPRLLRQPAARHHLDDETGWFDFLKGTAVYDPDRMNLDRELLRQYYLKNGYADVQVDGGQRRARPRRLGLLHHLRDRGRRALHVRRRQHREHARRPSSPTSFTGELLTDEGDTYNASADRQDGREADARRVASRATPSRASARSAHARSGDAHDRASTTSSRKARASTSSASTSSATRAPRTT